jgi:hypothetical protein
VLDDLPLNLRGTDDSVPLDLGENDFTYLINLLTLSAATHKKTYIVSPPGETHAYACALLAALYPRLPTPLRHVLGCNTYTREPSNIKGIHLFIMENGSALPSDPRFKGHFFVDFARKSGIIESEGSIGRDYFSVYYKNLPARYFCERIFGEIKFWLTREPKIARGRDYHDAVGNRMARVLDINKITAEAVTEMPESFIRQGRGGGYADIIGHGPADFAAVDILRKVIALRDKGKAIADMDGWLGSYRLSPLVYEKLLHTLQGGD